jgi:hypothetical protein
MVQTARTVLARSTLTAIIQKYGLYSAKQAKMPLENVVTEMKNSIRMSPAVAIGPAPRRQTVSAFEIQFIYKDPAVAQRVTEDLVSSFMEYGLENALRTGQTDYRPLTLELLDAPSLPTVPSSPKLLALAIAGLAAGLVVGFLLALFRRSPKPA